MYIIDSFSRKPVYEQIVEQTEKLILIGSLKPDDQMPSVRSLSVSLSINPNTIQKAYTELDNRGLICSVPGKGCFVTKDAVKRIQSLKRNEVEVFDNVVKELVLAGLSADELKARIDSLYKGGTIQ